MVYRPWPPARCSSSSRVRCGAARAGPGVPCAGGPVRRASWGQRGPRQNRGLKVAKPWWRKRGWSTQGGLLSGVFRAAQRPTGAPGGLAAAWSPVEMVRLQPAPEARAAPPYPRPAASGELPRMGKRRTVGRVSTGQFARSLRRSRVHAE